MVRYFKDAPPADAAWAVFFLTGRRLKRLVSYPAIRDWTLVATGLDGWMLEECYSVVGDGAETAALVLDQVAVEATEDLSLAEWVEGRILPLRELDPESQQRRVSGWWRTLDRLQRFMLLKILTGELRVGVSQTLVVRALAQAADLPATTIAARMMGDWTPSPEWFRGLLSRAQTTRIARVRIRFSSLLRSTMRSRPSVGATIGWSSGNGTASARSWCAEAAACISGRAARSSSPIAFPKSPPPQRGSPTAQCSTAKCSRFATIGRSRSPRCNSASAARNRSRRWCVPCPVVFMAFDLLEDGGIDIRAAAAATNVAVLLELHLTGPAVLRTSKIVTAATWEELASLRAESRALGVEGPDAEAADRRRTASAAAAVTGGNGRSTRTRWTPS